MSIENRRQFENTRVKVELMEDLFARTRNDPTLTEIVRDLTLRSLRKRINQFKEEMARFEAVATKVR